MCEDETCPAVIDGLIPTKDDSHLTPQFSAFVAPALALAINLGGRHTIPIVPVAVPPIKPTWPGATTTTTTLATTTSTPGPELNHRPPAELSRSNRSGKSTIARLLDGISHFLRFGTRGKQAAIAPSKFRQDIQGLRAIAVGTVVLDHAHIPGFSGGFIGVDVFFVISGFLITGLLLGDIAQHARVRFLNFYSRRAQRILPAATVVILATCIASIALLGIIQARSVLVDGVWAVFFGANIHFASVGTNYFAASAATSPLQHYWSLAVEEQFHSGLARIVGHRGVGLSAKGRCWLRAPRTNCVDAGGGRRPLALHVDRANRVESPPSRTFPPSTVLGNSRSERCSQWHCRGWRGFLPHCVAPFRGPGSPPS